MRWCRPQRGCVAVGACSGTVGVMSKRALWAAVGAVAAGVFAVGLGVWSGSPTTEPPGVGSPGAALEAPEVTLFDGPKMAALAAELGCPAGRSPIVCVESSLLDGLGPGSYEDTLRRLVSMRDAMVPEPFPCHTLAHTLGRSAIVSAGGEALVGAVGDESAVCEYGFLHGAVEAAGWVTAADRIGALVAEACAPQQGETRAECVHAAGHAAAIANPRQLFAALDDCDRYGDEAHLCAHGALMAFSIGSPPFDGSDAWDWIRIERGDLDGVCDKVRTGYAASCWEFLWNAYVGRDDADVSDMLNDCPPPGRPFAEVCRQGSGKVLTQRNHTQDPAASFAGCPDDLAGACAYGVAWMFAKLAYNFGDRLETYDSVCGQLPEVVAGECRRAEVEVFTGVA
jgi:hypothetical protein